MMNILSSVFLAISNYLYSWLTPFWITLYVIMSILPSWISIYKCRKLAGSPELNEKYDAFARLDYKDWNPIVMPLVAFFTLAPLKMLLSFGIMVLYVFSCIWFMIGHKKGTPLSKWRLLGVRFFCFLYGRLHLLFVGITYISSENAEKVDYRKYLGPDWKRKFEGTGVIVANHQCWLDPLALENTRQVSFVAKEELNKIPIIS